MKRSPIRRKSRPRRQPDELERMAAFKAAALYQGGPCRVCGSRTALVAHHVVTRNHVEREGGDVWDSRNAMCLCSGGPSSCHESHHSRQRPIPLSAVPDAASEFADELLGRDRADAYWDRYYAPHR
jgi:5-methylcytosine-specific restriction endonuclease McrA